MIVLGDDFCGVVTDGGSGAETFFFFFYLVTSEMSKNL
jgi:hypothetical protein